ncbi:MAG: hypothetical protein E7349_00715 [Clostridiales bacterium]|nr:hypothetical protein [Clostridiales bacterium]
MFGYVRADTPYLYIKDDALYKAMYCGVCKGIAEVCGHSARMGLSYDVTFLSVLLHNLAGIDVKIEKQHCLTHHIRSRQMAEVDELTRKLGALNIMLVYYKYTDDIMDGDKGRGKRLWFKKGFARARRKYPEIERIVRDNLAAQEEAEKAKIDSIDRAADATANMLAEFSTYALGERANAYSRNLFYAIGKWIYLIDALDDYDKDKKKGAYNPFLLAYGAKDSVELTTGKHATDVQYVFNALFFDIRENLSHLEFKFNRDLSDNILLRGLPMMTKRIMSGCDCNGRCKNKGKCGKQTQG